MLETPAPARTVIVPVGRNYLNLLVNRIAAGDRAAFRSLYTLLAPSVWRNAIRVLPRPVDARAVSRATFVEIWHLARHHSDPGTDVHVWAWQITSRRADERLRAPDTPCPIPGDELMHHELIALLGADTDPTRGPAEPARRASP